jgi:predicted molibdopterin-dependent oxidoreductase YjgC
MRQVTPEFWGITYERLEREGGVHWPCPSQDHPGTPFLFAESFPRGRGKFWSLEFGSDSEQPDEEYPFVLSTGRVLYHWHGGTLSRNSKLDEIWPEATVEIHPGDAEQLGVRTGDWLEVASRRGAIQLRAMVTGRSPAGVVFIPFHFVEASANVLPMDRIDPRAKIPDFKGCAVRLRGRGAGRAGIRTTTRRAGSHQGSGTAHPPAIQPAADLAGQHTSRRSTSWPSVPQPTPQGYAPMRAGSAVAIGT